MRTTLHISLVSLFLFTAATPLSALAAEPAAAEGDSEVPDGCFKTWLCYKPPAAEVVHPSVETNKVKMFFAGAILGPMFAAWPLADTEKPTYTDADLKDHLMALIIPTVLAMIPFLIAIPLYITIIGIPFAILSYILGYVAIMVVSVWIRPITTMHLVNRAVNAKKKGGGGGGGGVVAAPAAPVEPTPAAATPAG